ncbi:SDR family oxidoreductase [Pseudorhodoplanes sp.]|uniref:SDR family NAD(P)-dependent oxidoreductase n=1 Tax=Pseudorhodoplanes sp. TaxID=1934341 RepID=UPI002C747916|nr:SDR family oxidoreductase [Pseudorhodoplanes sp.]HWM83292.1 SDR family oxidoreductase [Pseudolabrys sp.]HWV55419.1 SDR family oxidoreductase [Pseudorhodoplanes sp.]
MAEQTAAAGTIVVTGASRGIGAVIAADLRHRGFSVAALSRSGEAASGTGYRCDVTDEASLKDVIARVARDGRIVGLVNNAGAHRATPSADLSVRELEETMRLNFTAAMVASREAYPYLKQAGGGTIVNIGSFFDKLGVAENIAYCASKAAVGALSRCLAVEWAKDSIRVLNVAPGYIETDLNRDFLAKDKVKTWLGRRVPVGRAGAAEEVARFVGTLFSDNIMFLTGETIYLDGGQGINH